MFIYSYFVQSIIMLYMILIVLWTIVKRLNGVTFRDK